MIVMRLDDQGVAHAQHQLTGIHRLRQKVRGTQLQGLLLDAGIADGGQDHDRHVTQLVVTADLVQDLDAADLRHHDVQQRDVRALSAEQLHRLRGVGRGDEVRVTIDPAGTSGRP